MRLILRRTTQLATSVLCLALLALTSFAPRWQPSVRANGCLAPPAGIVSWWPASGDANDLVGDRHGAAQNGAAFAVGQAGAGFSLDGADDFFSFASQPVANYIKPQFTIEFWANPGATPDRPTFGFAGSGTANTNNPVASYDDYLSFGDGAGGFQIMAPLPVAPANTWTHYAIVDDGTTYSVYVNGVFAFNALITAHPGGAGSRSFVIGQSGFSSGFEDYFKGVIDEFTIYDNALSPATVAAIHAAGSAGKCVTGADVKVTKTANTTHPDVDTEVTYTITVQNLSGVNAANNVVVTDNLPSPQLSYVAGSCMATLGGVCGGSGNNRTVTFASLAPGATATITLKAKVAACLADGTTITNTASATSSTPDLDTSNNSSSFDVWACDTSYIYPYSLGYYVIGLAAGGGTGTVQVFTPSPCSWTATAMTITGAPGWLTITSPASGMGTGNGTINYSFTANPGPGAREAKITVTFASGAVWKVVFSQGAAGVAYAAGGRVFNLTRTGGVAGVLMTFSVASGTGCNLPGNVITDAGGFWNQSGFTPGCVYRVVPSKPPLRFRLAFQQFSRASTNINFYQF
jgi:uncharacterized repeat protein (TIGR01451 family)